jgi:hypothetical protein
LTPVEIQAYLSYFVRFAPDGTIWTIGIDMINANPNAKAFDQSHHLIRQFDATGKQIASCVPRNRLPELAALDLSGDIMSGVFAAGQGRVDWYAPSGNRYLELSSEDVVTQYPDIPQLPANQVYSLDRRSKNWTVVHLPEVNSIRWSTVRRECDGHDRQGLRLSVALRSASKALRFGSTARQVAAG